MGWFSTDLARLDVAMDFSLDSGRGRAAVNWLQIREVPTLSSTQQAIAAAVLIYGRTLFVTNEENRRELFARVHNAAVALRQSGLFVLTDWSLEAGGRQFWIWPWAIEPTTVPIRGKTYSATLRASKGGSLFIKLKVPLGLDRVLAPSAALIVLHVLSSQLEGGDLQRLAGTLLAVNEYYGHPDAAKAIGSDTKAFTSALPHLLS